MEHHNEREEAQDARNASERDLGTVGGGKVPMKSFSTGGGEADESGAKQGVETENKRLSDQTGGEEKLRTVSGGENASEQGNIGGLNPGQPRKEIGDRDRPRAHEAGETGADPMTSRTPYKNM